MTAPVMPPMPFSLRFDPVVGSQQTQLAEHQRNFLESGTISDRWPLIPEGTYMVQMSTLGPDRVILRSYTGSGFRALAQLPAASAGTFRSASVTVAIYGPRRRLYVDYYQPATSESLEVSVMAFPIADFTP